ncbi:hypothetical protein OKW42_003532 [Paraburkholderia sp. WC7.3d]
MRRGLHGGFVERLGEAPECIERAGDALILLPADLAVEGERAELASALMMLASIANQAPRRGASQSP